MAFMLVSCDATIHFYPEPDGEDTGRGKSQIRLNVDWSGYGKTVPTGMTVLCHHTATGERVRVIDNNTSHVTPHLATGRHWATVFNLTEGEFNYIAFRGLDDVATAEAYAPKAEDSKWYKSRGDGNGNYVAGQPEWLAADTIMTDHVTATTDGTIQTIGTLYPKNIIYTLHLTIHAENISNLKSARAAISGLAAGRRLAADRPADNAVTVTHLIEASEWSRTRTSSPPDMGIVKADIRCFGLPANHLGSADENILEFYAMLGDGKTVLKYEIPVGHLIIEGESPPDRQGDNLDLYLDLLLNPPLPPGEDDDWGFDAWVEDWEEEDVHIPLM